MHADERQSGGGRRGLCERQADEQRTNQAGPLGDGNAVKILPGAPLSSSARSTTPQMSRTCCRGRLRHDPPTRDGSAPRRDDAERIVHGAASPVSSTIAAAVSSHEVSIPRIRIIRTRASAIQ
jgi:hypothetical protein